MKKKLVSGALAAACLAVLLLSLTACGDDTAQKGSTAAAVTPVEATASVPDCCGG